MLEPIGGVGANSIVQFFVKVDFEKYQTPKKHEKLPKMQTLSKLWFSQLLNPNWATIE